MSWSTLQKFAEFLPHLLMFSIIKKIYSIKQRKKNLRKSTRVHLPNSQSGSWDWDNTIEKKEKKTMKLNSQPTQCWEVKSEKKSIRKKQPNKKWLRVNLLNPRSRIWDRDNPIENK